MPIIGGHLGVVPKVDTCVKIRSAGRSFHASGSGAGCGAPDRSSSRILLDERANQGLLAAAFLSSVRRGWVLDPEDSDGCPHSAVLHHLLQGIGLLHDVWLVATQCTLGALFGDRFHVRVGRHCLDGLVLAVEEGGLLHSLLGILPLLLGLLFYFKCFRICFTSRGK